MTTSDLRLVHWSDLHFATSPVPTLAPARAVQLASEAVNRDFGADDLALVISGDITTMGRAIGYTQASRALRGARGIMNLSAVAMCPGNHDISAVNPTDFVDFNRFAFETTRDPQQQWDSRNPVRVVEVGDYSLLLVNSAFKGDHSTGAIPLAELRSALDRTALRHQIVVLHHSPISSAYAGGGLADAYDFLALVGQYDVAAVLHGHVHSDQGLHFGSYSTWLFGAGSLGFEPDPNMNNQFVVHEFSNGVADRTRLYRYYRSSDQFEGGSI
ncbi:metallophosphoesterase family protein [Leifsonia sp. NPDC014704]|uniref:metallophosphoesterase family protein n=1 Tax=Leifsonia sp. NPDC014704 TaxID=3364123 RepID=UPI0036F47226